MASHTTRLAIVAVLLLFAGCGGSFDTQTPGATQQTVAPATLPDSEATDRALEAETDYVSARLENASCLSYGETGEFTASAEATVTNRTQNGVVLNVQRPYSWAKNDTVADLVSNASYLVTKNQTNRRSGTSISPC